MTIAPDLPAAEASRTEASLTDAPPAPPTEQLPALIEALLFVADGPVDEGTLARAAHVLQSSPGGRGGAADSSMMAMPPS